MTRRSCPTHCCPVHGCKYGHPSNETDQAIMQREGLYPEDHLELCPVSSRQVEPEYPNNNGCEYCEIDREDNARALHRLKAVPEYVVCWDAPAIGGYNPTEYTFSTMPSAGMKQYEDRGDFIPHGMFATDEAAKEAALKMAAEYESHSGTPNRVYVRWITPWQDIDA